MTDYTASNPYPNRQLLLCEDTLGRPCAASATYLVSGTAAQGGGSFFDWLTTPDAGRTFKNVRVSSAVLSNRVLGSNTLVPAGGDPLIVYISPLTNSPVIITPAATRATASGSGEDAASWAKADFPRNPYGQNLHADLPQYSLMGAVPPHDPGKVTFAGMNTLYQVYPTTSQFIGTTLTLAHSYDNFTSVRNGLKLSLMGLTRILKNGGSGQPLNPDFPAKTLPWMIPAKEGQPAAGPGLAPRLRISDAGEDNQSGPYHQAWNLAAMCYGDTAETLYAIGYYQVAHPDTHNLFLMPYLIKSRDSGNSWIALDPDAADLLGTTTDPYPVIVQPYYSSQPGFVWTGYDLQPDGSYTAAPQPPIVFPVADKNGTPLCLPAVATGANSNGSVSPLQTLNEANHPQMVFAHGVLYFAYRNTVISQNSGQGSQQPDYGTSHYLDEGGKMVSTALRTSASDPAIPQSAYTWAFGRSGDLGRTWEGLTSPPPMHYGALGLSHGGDRLLWGLHHHSDDGGHTWDEN